MVSRSPLTKWQIEVLRWIGDGCPERHWPNATHKTTALALQSRRLATVSKRRGVWAAETTDAGKHYLAAGEYPVGHWSRYEKSAQVQPSTPVPPPVRRDPPPSAPNQRQQADAVLDRLVTVGDSLDYDERVEGLTIHDLTRLSRHAANLPIGKKLSFERVGGWLISTYKLRFVDDIATSVDERPVPVPQRIVRHHPATAAYVADVDRHEVSRDSLKRAERIVEALAREATRRGYQLTPVRSDRLTDGQDQIEIDGFKYPLRIREASAASGRPIDFKSGAAASCLRGKPSVRSSSCRLDAWK